MPDRYTPRPEHQFSFGLWTVGNRGRDPFGDVVRPALPPNDAVAMLAEAGAWGVNLHDNDLVPIDASSGAAIKSPDWMSATASSRRSCRLTRCRIRAAFLLLRRKLQSPGQPQPT